MSSERESTRAVLAWLREPARVDAERVVARVLGQVELIPQRRSLWPARRYMSMNTRTQAIVAAAAVVVVAIFAYNLLPRSGLFGGEPATSATTSPTANPTITSTISPTATPSTAAPVFPPSGPIAAGRQSISRLGLDVSFMVPTPDWTSDGSIGLSRGTEGAPTALGFIFWTETPVGIFSDPCGNTRGPVIGSDRAALAAAITSIPGIDVVSEPAETTVGGRPATSVAVTVREDVGCEPSSFFLWYSQFHSRYASELGFTVWTWIVDVDGTLIWIDGETYTGAGLEPAQAVQQLVDSITFD